MKEWFRYYFLWNEFDVENVIRKNGFNLSKREERAFRANTNRIMRKILLRSMK